MSESRRLGLDVLGRWGAARHALSVDSNPLITTRLRGARRTRHHGDGRRPRRRRAEGRAAVVAERGVGGCRPAAEPRLGCRRAPCADAWSALRRTSSVWSEENEVLRERVAMLELEDDNLQFREALVTSGHLERIAEDARTSSTPPCFPSQVVGLDVSPLFPLGRWSTSGAGQGVHPGNPVITNRRRGRDGHRHLRAARRTHDARDGSAEHHRRHRAAQPHPGAWCAGSGARRPRSSSSWCGAADVQRGRRDHHLGPRWRLSRRAC